MKKNYFIILGIVCLFLGLLFLNYRNNKNIVYNTNNTSVESIEKTNEDNLVNEADKYVYDKNWYADFFGSTKVSFIKDDSEFPSQVEFWTEASCKKEDKYEYIAPPGYEINKCEDAGIGTYGGCPTCVMSKVILNKIKSSHNSFPSFIKVEPGNMVIEYDNYGGDIDNLKCSDRYSTSGFEEGSEEGIYEYYNHYGQKYGTGASFQEDVDLEYVGIKNPIGSELINELFIDFSGGLNFKSSQKENNFLLGLVEEIIPTVDACAWSDYQGQGGAYTVSSKLNFVKEEKGIRWYSPEEKMTLGPDIETVQISYSKKSGFGGKIVLAVDNFIFKKDNKYFYPKNNQVIFGGNVIVMSECLKGDFYYKFFMKEEIGNIDFEYNDKENKFVITLKNTGNEEIVIDESSIQALPILSLDVFNGEDVNSENKIFSLDLSPSSDFSKKIIGEKISPKDNLKIYYDLTIDDRKVVSVKTVKNINKINNTLYKNFFWSLNDPYIYNNSDRIELD